MNPGASIPIATVPNLRDLGGWPTADGRRVRAGLAYRSTALNHLQGDDLAAFAGLGIRAVYDLRTAMERDSQPDRLPGDVAYVVVDVRANATDVAPAELARVLSDPTAATAMLEGGKAAALFTNAYRNSVSRPSALAGYRRLFPDLAQADQRPALVHCTTGKDRTGWAAAALMMLLGVSSEDVLRDFLLTNDELLPALPPVFDRFAAAGGDPALLRLVLGVEAVYLGAARDEMRQRYGTIERYLAEGLRIDSAARRELRAAFIEDAREERFPGPTAGPGRQALRPGVGRADRLSRIGRPRRIGVSEDERGGVTRQNPIAPG
jgi:protein-tyrosine phosphatase